MIKRGTCSICLDGYKINIDSTNNSCYWFIKRLFTTAWWQRKKRLRKSRQKKNNKHKISMLYCGHYFHKGCLDPWINKYNYKREAWSSYFRSRLGGNCPLCRKAGKIKITYLVVN